MFSSFFCSLSFTGTMGKGAIIQTGKSPMGLPVQISGNQKNKLNDPGGGSFRYTLSSQERACRSELPPHEGSISLSRFSMTTGYTQLRLWVFIWAGCPATWLPAWPTGWLVVLSFCAHLRATRSLPIDHPHTCPPCVSVTCHWQCCKWAKS